MRFCLKRIDPGELSLIDKAANRTSGKVRRRSSAENATSTSRLIASCASFDGVVFSHVLEHLNDPVAAVKAATKLLKAGGKMFWAMAGAMSSAQLGITLAPAIRAGLVHGLSVTGANGLLDRVDALCFAAPIFFHSVRWYFGV